MGRVSTQFTRRRKEWMEEILRPLRIKASPPPREYSEKLELADEDKWNGQGISRQYARGGGKSSKGGPKQADRAKFDLDGCRE
ncbi:hypothetical protein BSKO_05773 [Bryopsis sp. KO-2023]|nr:hypothetical protein BSKO_05773 [Bryopsis sp. KO-2023]